LGLLVEGVGVWLEEGGLGTEWREESSAAREYSDKQGRHRQTQGTFQCEGTDTLRAL
jgi:hypothetical protein